MGAVHENLTGPLEDEFGQGLIDSDGWIWGIESGNKRPPLTSRFLSRVPFIGKHFAEVTELTATESEA